MEDYAYRDNEAQMGATALRLMETLSAYIGEASGRASKGIIVLATNPKATPNTSIAPLLNEKGYPNLTRSELLTRVGGNKVEVLNVGTGIGYLRYVKAREEDDFSATAQDILIYENLPARVPPVNGIITLEPQTPLSHINLLAKNRGTINLYVLDLKALPRAKELLNKLVRIECSDNRISLTEVDLKTAEAFWAERVVKVDIPQPAATSTSLIDLNVPNDDQGTHQIGAKAANYARIRQQFPEVVKLGFALPGYLYFDIVEYSEAPVLIGQLLKEKPTGDTLQAQLKAIRKAIREADVPTFIIEEVSQLIQNEYQGARIRLRSSTKCEDLPAFNGAGLYVSKGFNASDGPKVLEEKILKVYASMWSELAYKEREFYLVDHTKAFMAILINPAFSEEYANGVVLTMPEGEDYAIYINSQWGESSVTNPENGQLPETIVIPSAKNDRFEFRSKSTLHDVFLEQDLQELLPNLKQVTMDIHELLTRELEKDQEADYGVDLEFKIMKEGETFKLYIKQARLSRTILNE